MSIPETLNERGMGALPGLIGLTILDAEEVGSRAAWICVRSSWPRTATCTRRRWSPSRTPRAATVRS